jgi:hypothetical protein
MAVDRTTSDARPLDQVSAHGEAVDQEAADREAALWADLASNAIVLASATEDRCRLLVARARLWDQLADLSTPACGRAYRDAAFTCRAEAAGHRARAEPDPTG